MPERLELGEGASGPVLDGALGLALATGAPLRLQGPLSGADLAMAVAAARLARPSAAEELRARFSRPGPIELEPGSPHPGVHTLELREPGAVARALSTFAWPLSLAGRPVELRLAGPNHAADAPSFHDLRLAWVPAAARFGLRVRLELLQAAFEGEGGLLVAHVEPAPALTAFHALHRGILRSATVVAAVAGGAQKEAQAAAEAARRVLRRLGVSADSERVPLPVPPGARGRFSITVALEFERSAVTASEPGPGGLRVGTDLELATAAGERAAERVGRFLARGGAVDAGLAERLLLPAILCAGGVGARAGAAPGCDFATSEVTPALLELATLGRRALPVRAVVDGAPGDEGVVAVAPL